MNFERLVSLEVLSNIGATISVARSRKIPALVFIAVLVPISIIYSKLWITPLEKAHILYELLLFIQFDLLKFFIDIFLGLLLRRLRKLNHVLVSLKHYIFHQFFSKLFTFPYFLRQFMLKLYWLDSLAVFECHLAVVQLKFHHQIK